MRAVVLGSRIRIITAAKRLGLYSAFLAWSAIFFKSNLHPRLTVETIFLRRNETFQNCKIPLYLDKKKVEIKYEAAWTYCNCGTIPGSAEVGPPVIGDIMGVIGPPGVGGPPNCPILIC